MDKLMEKLETDPNFRKFNTPLNSPTSQQRGSAMAILDLKPVVWQDQLRGGERRWCYFWFLFPSLWHLCHITGLHTHIHICVQLQLLWASLVVQGIHLQWWRLGFSPWVGKIPWRRNDNPVQYSCLKNPMDRGAWQTTVHGVMKELDMI